MNPLRSRLYGWVCMLLVTAGLAKCVLAQDRGMKCREVLGEDTPIPRYHAMVVGINRYNNDWVQLTQAQPHAAKLAALLRTHYGFQNIVTLYDEAASQRAILSNLYALAGSLGANDALLIYFAGHGYYDKKFQNGYWIPADGPAAEGTNPSVSRWIQDVTLKELISKTEARHVLVLSDACFSGALLRGEMADMLGARENTYYRRAITQPTRWAMTSGNLEPVPDMSVFSAKVIQALEYPRQDVFSASDIINWVRKEVAAETGCQPRFGSLRTTSSSDVGEFVFVRMVGGVVPLPKVGRLHVRCDSAGTLTVADKRYPVKANSTLHLERPPGPVALRLEGRGVPWVSTVVVAADETITVAAGLGIAEPVSDGKPFPSKAYHQHAEAPSPPVAVKPARMPVLLPQPL